MLIEPSPSVNLGHAWGCHGQYHTQLHSFWMTRWEDSHYSTLAALVSYTLATECFSGREGVPSVQVDAPCYVHATA